MKQHTSMKICKRYPHVCRAGYADLQFILAGRPADYYNAGVYGWNCDIYTDDLHGLIISTGYRNTRGKTIPRDIINTYNYRAALLPDDWTAAAQQARADLIRDFFAAVAAWLKEGAARE